MSFQGQVFIISYAIFLLILVVELLRRHKINEATTLWWFSILFIIIVFAINQNLLLYFTYLIGAKIPVSVLTMMSLSLILLMLIYFSMKISNLSKQVKDISQYIALLEKDITHKD